MTASLSDAPTKDLVEELRKRHDTCIGLQVNEGEPFEISIDAEDIEVPWAEGPGVILLVFE